MKPSRFQSARPADTIKTKITDLTIGHDKAGLKRTFFYAQVIDSVDPQNANRIRVRIPLLDNPYYTDENGKLTETGGNDSLPFCIPAHGRIIDTPENGSVVLVALMDPSNPFLGRIWFSAVPELSSKDIFDVDRLADEDVSNAWANAEEAINVKYNNTPGRNGRPTLKSKTKQTNDKVGIRGKGKNKVLLEKDKTSITQNEGVNQKETLIELSENLKMLSQEFEILSNKSNKKLHPVFDKPLWTFMQSQLNLLNQIVVLLNSSPGTGNLGYPVAPAATAAAIQVAYNKLKVDFAKLKQDGEGHSKYITIN